MFPFSGLAISYKQCSQLFKERHRVINPELSDPRLLEIPTSESCARTLSPRLPLSHFPSRTNKQGLISSVCVYVCV